jgi:tetratricopeptide (TPR) repeat protein
LSAPDREPAEEEKRVKRRCAAGLLTAVATIIIAAPARAETDDLVRRALALEAKGQMGEAYSLLAPQIAARAGDPDFDYALGLAAADSGQTGQAIAAFQRVLAVQPKNAQARTEIARVYALAGDVDTARAEFDTVIDDPTVPDPVRQRLNRLVRDYDRQIGGGGGSVDGFIDAEGGYDDNINTATGLTSITLPVFAFLGPATLSGPGTRMDDRYYQLQGGLSGSTALSRQDRLYLSALGSWRDNARSHAFDQAAVTGTLGGSHAFAGGDVASLSGQVQRFWLGGTGYRTSLGTIGQYTARLKGGAALSAQAQYYRQDYDGDPSRDANRYAATLTYSGKTAFLALGGGREATVRQSARNLGYWFASAQAGIEQPVSPAIAILAGASIERRDYVGQDPLFLRGRLDTQVDVTFGLRIALGRGFSLRPRATYTRNFSGMDLYDYARITASAGVRFEF